MPLYNAVENEKKWQKIWGDKKMHSTNLEDFSKPKYYNLVMFPYPSGDKLHIGHWYNYAPADSWGRYMKMKGFNVFEPQGFDSFGLPAENYAIKTGVHPTVSISQNVEHMREQLHKMGTMYDWDKSVVTSEPDYYQWTQWVFLQLYKKGLAYRKNAPVNWCPSCQTVLANEQVLDGRCERCKHEVTKRDLTQWFFKIRDYAERLLNFESLDWPERTKLMQQNWIGKSIGSEVTFELCDEKGNKSGEKVTVFTTRIDTLFGATYMVLAPEHALVGKITTEKHKKNVAEYIEKTRKETDIDRSAEDREKTGVETGAFAVNPANGEIIPVWIGDYVLVTYGTGAVMAVPANDQRDGDFAKKYNLPIKFVVVPSTFEELENIGSSTKIHNKTPTKDQIKLIEKQLTERAIKDYEKYVFTANGVLINSGEFTGLTSEEARKKITEWLAERKSANFTVNYKLRDWLVSRQRYWGAPIPIVFCEKCGEVAVPESELPVLLPKDVDFAPKGDGKSPLNSVESFVHTKCPECGGPAKREVDTMDTFVDSSWYFLRYPSAKMSDKAFDKDMTKNWLPVDMYIGGPEHACMHLLYARFINMVLHDQGFIDFEEPFKRLVHQGMITKDGAKMSKSKGNVVSPDQFVEKYGSDTFRLYLMFMGPFSEGGDWNDKGITGIARFLERFYQLVHTNELMGDKAALQRLLHKTIKKVTADIEVFHFNTAIAALMEFVNGAMKIGMDDEVRKTATLLIAPLAPHLAEELWEKVGGVGSVFEQTWPVCDETLIVEDSVQIAVQVNGKLRAQITIATDADKDTVLAAAKIESNVAKYLDGKKLVKEIYVPGKLVSLVIAD